jgi:hypothetical protein
VIWGGAPSQHVIIGTINTGSAGTAVTADALMAVEILVGLLADGALPGEFAATQISDRQSQVEILASLRGDRGVVTEILGTARGDANAPTESAGRQVADTKAPAEWSGAVAVQSDRMIPLEGMARQTRDILGAAEDVAGARGDSAAPAESAATARSDRPVALEMLSIQTRDGGLPLEWTGAIIVTADAFAALETAGLLVRDHGAQAESGSKQIADRVLAVESLAGAARDLGGVASESLARLLGNSAALAEWAGSLVVAIDALLPIEGAAGLGADLRVLAEILSTSQAITGDAHSPIEILGAILREASLPDESLAAARAELLAELEAGVTIPAALLSIARGRLLASPGRIRLTRR